MFNIFFLIVILFMCVVLPLGFLLPTIVSEINTGGSPLFIFIAIAVIGVCVTVAIVAYVRAVKKPDPTPEEEKQGFAWIDEMKKAKLANDLGGEGAKVTMEFTEEIVTENSELTEFEQKALENKNLDGGEINWTVTSAKTTNNTGRGYTAGLTQKDKAMVQVKKASNKVQTTFKIIGIIVLLAIEFLFVFGTIRRLTVFGDIHVNDISIKSLSNVAGYYIHCPSYNESAYYGTEALYEYSYSYSTNKKTNELYDKYKEYLTDTFSYHPGTDTYYVINPKNSSYAYMIKVSKSEKQLSIRYSYDSRPSYF